MSEAAHRDKSDGTDRDVLHPAAAGDVASASTSAAVYPLINQTNPSADNLAPSAMRADPGGIERATHSTITLQRKPVFLPARIQSETGKTRTNALIDWPDKKAQNANPADDAHARDVNRALSEEGIWLDGPGVCTHHGRVALGKGGNFGGWFCLCHGSRCDAAGFIRKGSETEGLDIPVAIFGDETRIQRGA